MLWVEDGERKGKLCQKENSSKELYPELKSMAKNMVENTYMEAPVLLQVLESLPPVLLQALQVKEKFQDDKEFQKA